MKPRVLMIAYACDPEGSGEHWLGWGWAEQAAKDFSVHLVTTPNARAQVERHASHHGITPHFVAQPGGSRWGRKLGWQKRVMRFAGELHSRENFALVHQTTFHTFRVPFLAAGLGIPSVWGPIAGGESVPPGFGRELGGACFSEWARRLGNKLSLLLPSVRRSLVQSSAIFVSNRTTLEFLPAQFRAKCVVVPPNALRLEDEQLDSSSSSPSKTSAKKFEDEHENEDEDDPFRLLYVGNCVATRALPLVFEAMRHSRLKNVQFTVVGSGPAREHWRRLVQRFDLTESVELTGQVTRDKLPDFYSRADALVFPALRDSGGSALLEAMARGLPVICLDWGGPGEMADANCGVKIPVRSRPETVAALAAAIARLAALPRLRQTLARAARERALAHFRWEAKARLLHATYQRLLATP